MAALFAGRLSQVGITAPLRPFEGIFGVWEQATGPFDLGSLGAPVGGLAAVERTSCKSYPSDFETQIPAEVFIGLHDEAVGPDDIESIDVSTYYVSWHLIGGGQGDHDEKWDPRRRETADHSLPYAIAVALTDGRLSKASFTAGRVMDPALRPLMQRITVVEDPELTRTWRTHPAYDIRVRLRNGQSRDIHVDHPRGHYLRPFTDDEVNQKFEANAAVATDSHQGARPSRPAVALRGACRREPAHGAAPRGRRRWRVSDVAQRWGPLVGSDQFAWTRRGRLRA